MKDKHFKKIYYANLQQIENTEYPFYLLNPHFCIYPGYFYWYKKFRPLIKKIKQVKKVKWILAQKELAKRISILELVPYHSKSTNMDKQIISKLNSVIDMKRYVHSTLLRKCQKDECLIVVVRSRKEWCLLEDKNVIIYKKGNRSFSLGPKSQAFKAICRFLEVM